MPDFTPSQLETLRETGSVRVVVKMDPQPDGFREHNGTPYVWQYDPRRRRKRGYEIESPLPVNGYSETIDGMECEWVERGCEQAKELTEEHRVECGYRLQPEVQVDSDGAPMQEPHMTTGIQLERDLGLELRGDTWLWTAIVRRKDDGDE